MKKYFLPHIFGLLVLYAGILLLLGTIQFSGRGAFTKQVGALLIAGHYRSQEHPNQYALAGGLRISFAGMEFSLTGADDGFALVKAGGQREPSLPETMLVSGTAVTFGLSGGTKLVFAAAHTQENPGLEIRASLAQGVESLVLPYKPLKTAKIQDQADGQLVVVTDGLMYRFGRSLASAERHALIFSAEDPLLRYETVPETQELAFNPKDFIIPAGYDKQSYDKVVARWRDQSYTLWSRSMAGSNNEDLVVAYAGEAVGRGGYASAVAAVPSGFLNGSRRTYESSVFLGRLDQGVRSLSAAEREKMSRISRLVDQGSFDFLHEPHVFAYLADRGAGELIEKAAALARGMDPSAISKDILIGILEGYADWSAAFPEDPNPFGQSIAQTYLIIAQGIKKVPPADKVFVFFDTADIEFNLRLGKALMVYAESAGNNDWAAIGRSLAASVIALAADTGTAPAFLRLLPDNTAAEDTDSPRVSAARLYRLLNPGENYPRAAHIQGQMWAWTGASSLTVTRENTLLDIAVAFPVGETHYLLIRGVPPPNRLQLYNIDYRTAPDFERYNSSGWSYSSAEQTLLIKMRHRSPVEHIRIFL
ncbi:MAG: hypothetical protein LBD13_00050 [Spirochaetaceae bacterium]|nr:hypothetical protein [Spirochaetaceae bacterium]